MNPTSKYFFRAPELRHLRVEQYMRYYSSSSREMSQATHEDTVLDDEVIVNAEPDRSHKNYDRFSEGVPEGTRFSSGYQGVEVARRRAQPRLAVAYHPALEPLGQKREPFYQYRCWEE